MTNIVNGVMKKAFARFHIILSTGILALIVYADYSDFIRNGFDKNAFLFSLLGVVNALSSCLLAGMILRTDPAIKSKSTLLKELTLENALLAKEIENRSLKEKVNKQV